MTWSLSWTSDFILRPWPGQARGFLGDSIMSRSRHYSIHVSDRMHNGLYRVSKDTWAEFVYCLARQTLGDQATEDEIAAWIDSQTAEVRQRKGLGSSASVCSGVRAYDVMVAKWR